MTQQTLALPGEAIEAKEAALVAHATSPPPGLMCEERFVDLIAPEFYALIEAGVFPPERRVFLWEGRLCEKMAKTVPHWATAYAISEAIRPHLGPEWILCSENPVELGLTHVPLPDVIVMRGPLDRYTRERRNPDGRDVGLIVEVAVTSRAKDLGERAEKYAHALVPNYWVADAPDRCLVAHSQPQILDGVGSYRTVQTVDLDHEIELVLSGVAVARLRVADLIPKIG